MKLELIGLSSVANGTPSNYPYRDVKILAAGPLTKQPATMLYRIVLVQIPEGFAVWRQQFEKGEFLSGYFHDGYYFKPEEFTKATMTFAGRVGHDAESHYESVYREQGDDPKAVAMAHPNGLTADDIDRLVVGDGPMRSIPMNSDVIIPDGVYYNIQCDNFFDRETKIGKGTPFYNEYHEYRSLFPRE